jgi:hypothetical protein
LVPVLQAVVPVVFLEEVVVLGEVAPVEVGNFRPFTVSSFT